MHDHPLWIVNCTSVNFQFAQHMACWPMVWKFLTTADLHGWQLSMYKFLSVCSLTTVAVNDDLQRLQLLI